MKQTRVNPDKPEKQTFKGHYPLEKFGRFAETEEEQQDPQPDPQELTETNESHAVPPVPAHPAAPAHKPELVIHEISDDEDVNEPAAEILPDEVYEAQDAELDAFIQELDDSLEVQDDTQDEVAPESSLKPPQSDSASINDPAPSIQTISASELAPIRKRKPTDSPTSSENSSDTELIHEDQPDSPVHPPQSSFKQSSDPQPEADFMENLFNKHPPTPVYAPDSPSERENGDDEPAVTASLHQRVHDLE